MSRELPLSIIAIALCACGATHGGTDNDHPATVSGTADGEHGRATDVGVYRIGSDGSLETISSGQPEIDASGNYSVDALVSEGGDRDLVVRVTFEDGATRDGPISGPVKPGDQVQAPPIDDETDAEADLTVSVVASGALSTDDDRAALIRAFVDSDVGAAWQQADDDERSITASAVASAVVAWNSTMEERGDADAALSAYVSALADLSTSSGDGDALSVLLESASSAGYDSLSMSLMASAAFEASGHAAGSDDGEASAACADLLSELRLTLMTEAVEDAWPQGSPSTLQASGDLLLEVVVEILAGGGSTSEVDEAVANYSVEVLAELRLTLGLTSSTTMDEAESMAGDARGELEASIRAASSDAETSGQQIGQAMSDYDASANVDVAAFLSSSGFSASDASAAARIISQVTLAGG